MSLAKDIHTNYASICLGWRFRARKPLPSSGSVFGKSFVVYLSHFGFKKIRKTVEDLVWNVVSNSDKKINLRTSQSNYSIILFSRSRTSASSAFSDEPRTQFLRTATFIWCILNIDRVCLSIAFEQGCCGRSKPLSNRGPTSFKYTLTFTEKVSTLVENSISFDFEFSWRKEKTVMSIQELKYSAQIKDMACVNFSVKFFSAFLPVVYKIQTLQGTLHFSLPRGKVRLPSYCRNATFPEANEFSGWSPPL